MVDSNTPKLDLYDKKILYELDRHARISTTRLGKKIRKSKQFVDYRIKKLEDEGIIKGYVTVIDYARLGYLSMRVYFKFHNVTPEKQKEIEAALTKDSSVWWLVTLEGVWDVGYAVAVKDVLDFYQYWNPLMDKYREYIQKRSVVVYTHIKQFPKSYLLNEPNTHPGTLIGATKKGEELKAFDRSLLKLLSDKARLPLVDIAEKLSSSPSVVKKHLKHLENLGVIQGYRALIDVSALGYRYYKSYITFLDTSRLHDFEAFCLRHPNILNTNKTIGGKDFEIELQAKDFNEFDSIMNELRSTFKSMISDFEFVIAREEKKMEYFPFGG